MLMRLVMLISVILGHLVLVTITVHCYVNIGSCILHNMAHTHTHNTLDLQYQTGIVRGITPSKIKKFFTFRGYPGEVCLQW